MQFAGIIVRETKSTKKVVKTVISYKAYNHCARMFENTATYFGELLMQEGGQGAEKWQRLSFFCLLVVFGTADACKVSFQREDCNILIIGEFFSGAQKKCCPQGRRTAKLLHPVGKTDVLAIFWPFFYMAAYFWTPGNMQFL